MPTPFLSPQPRPPPMSSSTETSKYLYATKSHTSTPICHCGTPPETTYHHPLIACASKKCKTRYYHMHCVDLTHQHLLSNEPWFCRDCRLAQTLLSLPTQMLTLSPPPRVCVCEVPPYIMGPMVQCARKAKCEVRWFHWVCVGFPEEGCGWVCEACFGCADVGDEEEEVVEVAKRVKVFEGVVEEGLVGEVTVGQHDCAVHGIQLWEDAVAGFVGGKGGEGVVVEEPGLDGVDGVEEWEERRNGGRVGEATTAEVTTLEVATTKSTTPESTTPKLDAPEPMPLENTIPELTTTESTKPERVVLEHTTPESTTTEPGYCFCGTPDTNDMIACDSNGCATEWFHFTCVGLEPKTVPKGKWFCDECVEKVVKRKRSKVAGRKRKR